MAIWREKALELQRTCSIPGQTYLKNLGLPPWVDSLKAYKQKKKKNYTIDKGNN